MDITLCTNNKCKLAKKCYRHLVKSDIVWQSQAAFEPVFSDEPGVVKCDFFMDYRVPNES